MPGYSADTERGIVFVVLRRILSPFQVAIIGKPLVDVEHFPSRAEAVIGCEDNGSVGTCKRAKLLYNLVQTTEICEAQIACAQFPILCK